MIFNLYNNKKFTQTETETLTKHLSYADIECEGVEFARNKGLRKGKAEGCFSILFRNSIFLAWDMNVNDMTPVAAHELKHREQFKRHGFLIYVILAFPLWRKWTIEPEAYAEQDRVDLIERLDNYRQP